MKVPWGDLPRVTDKDGHSIPITGTWCTACGYPTHPDHGHMHPMCDTSGAVLDPGPRLTHTSEKRSPKHADLSQPQLFHNAR